MPDEVAGDDVREMYGLLTTVESVSNILTGNSENVMAWTRVEAGCADAHFIAGGLNGCLRGNCYL